MAADPGAMESRRLGGLLRVLAAAAVLCIRWPIAASRSAVLGRERLTRVRILLLAAAAAALGQRLTALEPAGGAAILVAVVMVQPSTRIWPERVPAETGGAGR